MNAKLPVIILPLLVSTLYFDSNASEMKLTPLYEPEITSVSEAPHRANKSHDQLTSSSRFIIQLKSPSLAQYNVSSNQNRTTNKGRISLTSKDSKDYLSTLTTEQNAFSLRLKQQFPALTLERSFKTLFNGFSFSADAAMITRISAMPEVKQVFQDKMFHTFLDTSIDQINAKAIWSKVSGIENAGKGIRVAIVDSGITPSHAMFSDQGMTAPTGGLPDDDYCSTVDPQFCNNKLIVARWIKPNFSICTDEHLSPLDHAGHGTHVAGIAVGRELTTTFKQNKVTLSGVAPAAYLMVYKGLYASSQDCASGVGSSSMLMEALENATNDGADVINNSWGGNPGGDPNLSAYQVMFEAAEKLGIVVVTAAGNDGNTESTIACPACIESGIAVANATTGRFFNNTVNINGSVLLVIAADNSASELSSDITAKIISAKAINADNELGCNPFAVDSFKNNIALISRGTCSFLTKANNAANAGATAMLVYNNLQSIPFSMALSTSNLPSFQLTKNDGEAILKILTDNTIANISSTVTSIRVPYFANSISSSSSRGPNGDPNVLKPDITAPGTNILSATKAGNNKLVINSGTSMASPHIAGSAALVKQLHPDWNATDIKTALTSTANNKHIVDDDFVTPATPFAMGAGQVDLAAASETVLTFDKPAITSASCELKCEFTRTVTNKSDKTKYVRLSAGLGTITPNTLVLAANASASFNLSIDAAHMTPDIWEFDQVTITSGTGSNPVHLPISVMARHSNNTALLAINLPKPDLLDTDDIVVTSSLKNTNLKDDDEVTFYAQAPKNTHFTSVNDVTVETINATQSSFNIDETKNSAAWTGTLSSSSITLTKSAGAFPSLIDDFNVTPFNCPGKCDESVIAITSIPSFKYQGKEYDAIEMSSNGMVSIGGNLNNLDLSNNALPNPIPPNNILAPLWADFDLSGDDSNDVGGGRIAFSLFNSAVGQWLALEWNKAQLFENTDKAEYTFAIWILLGDTEQIVFSYSKIPSMPDAATIGAENDDGTLGAQFYFNGSGDSVNDNERIAIGGNLPGQVHITYKTKAASHNFAFPDSINVDEDKQATFNVLKNDKADQKIATASVKATRLSAEVQRIISIVPSRETVQVSIVKQPSHGQLSVKDNGDAIYTPNKDFAGKDVFSYVGKDKFGNEIAKADVHINVIEVNDAPEVSATSTILASARIPVSINANGKDPDNARLTYQWKQISGDPVNFSPALQTLTFVPPDRGQTLVFEVTASDGIQTSPPKTVTVTVSSLPRNGGSMTWLILFVLPILFRRRYSGKSIFRIPKLT